MGIDPERWMGELDPEKLSAPLITIAIPGSHDSMTYSITPKSPVAPDSDLIVRSLIKYFGFIVRPIVYSWCVTQNSTVLEQLSLGIRYLDIRLGTKEDTNDIYFVHGLYGEKVNSAFEDIAKFLMEHQKEIVILDMQHFYGFSSTDHQNYLSILKSIFGVMLCPSPRDVTSVSLEWMQEHGYQVIIIYRDKTAQGEDKVWESKMWPTPWPQTMSPDDLLKFLNLKLKNRPKKCGFVSQCVLTPTNLTVIKSPFSSVRSKCAVPANKVTIPWLQEQETGLINVAICDFVHINNSDFPHTVLSLNFK